MLNSKVKLRPLVGLGILIFKDGKILLAKRKGSHGEGEYSTPGGHLEWGESLEGGIKREVKEETGIEIKNIKFQYLGNIKKYKGTHYVHIQFISDWKKGVPELLEPDKNGEWSWFSLDKLPKPLFRMTRLSIRALKSGKNYFDS